MENSAQTYCQSPNVTSRRLGQETLLVPVRGNLADMSRVFALNASGQVIWNALAEPCGLAQVVDRLVLAFDVDREVAAKDAAGVLDQMVAYGVVQTLRS